MSPDFTKCAAEYLGNTTLQSLYAWHGPVQGIPANPASQISYHGCLALCGTGSQYYAWSDMADTITQWVLPMIGIILQSPFESNAFWDTILALIRWIGNPISALSYILWNIKVTGKCAMLVDMSIPANQHIPDQMTDYSDIRDSFMILTAMNQFTVKRNVSWRREAEGLCRVVLFSKNLHLKNTRSTLTTERRQLAQYLRETRNRGVVPVYISTMWFLFALAISIEAAFDDIGANAVAHDLALGLLFAWLPVLILCSIVDRNFTSQNDVRLKINRLIDEVRMSIEDPEIRQDYLDRLADFPHVEHLLGKLRERFQAISDKSHLMEDYFDKFAGQGRTRWHYGVAHSILSDIERNYIAARGRAWLTFEDEARLSLVLGDIDNGIVWFDYRELWQIAASMFIVVGTILGGFVISYFTPTMGLGCRSGGYLIFMVLVVGQLVYEILIWWIATPVPSWLKLGSKGLETVYHGRQKSFVAVQDYFNTSQSWLLGYATKILEYFDTTMVDAYVSILRWTGAPPLSLEKPVRNLAARVSARETWGLQDWTEVFHFRPMEAASTIWLFYLTMAQVLGSYQTCACQSSNWGIGGGYMDFRDYSVFNSASVAKIWIAGTICSSAIMGLSMLYIVCEWCMQSHLTTENYDNARAGLHRTRQFRRLTWPYRFVFHNAVVTGKYLRYWICKPLDIVEKPSRKGCLWTHDVTYQPYIDQIHGNQGGQEDRKEMVVVGAASVMSDSDADAPPAEFVTTEKRSENSSGPSTEAQ